MKAKSFKSFFLLACCIAFGGILGCRAEVQELVEEPKGVLFAEKEHSSDIDTIVAEGADSVTGDMYADKYRYAKNTPEGVQMVDVNSKYTSGRLFYTVQSARLVRSTEEMGIPLSGFSYEARLYKNAENQWTEGNQPKWIQEDGTFDEDIYLILVDMILESDNAAMTANTDSPDPYLFRIDGLLSLFDGKDSANFLMMSYFSEMGKDPAHEFYVHIEPGQRIACTVGFVVEDQWLNNSGDLSQLCLCNTQGVKNSVYLDLGLTMD